MLDCSYLKRRTNNLQRIIHVVSHYTVIQLNLQCTLFAIWVLDLLCVIYYTGKMVWGKNCLSLVTWKNCLILVTWNMPTQWRNMADIWTWFVKLPNTHWKKDVWNLEPASAVNQANDNSFCIYTNPSTFLCPKLCNFLCFNF